MNQQIPTSCWWTTSGDGILSRNPIMSGHRPKTWRQLLHKRVRWFSSGRSNSTLPPENYARTAARSACKSNRLQLLTALVEKPKRSRHPRGTQGPPLARRHLRRFRPQPQHSSQQAPRRPGRFGIEPALHRDPAPARISLSCFGQFVRPNQTRRRRKRLPAKQRTWGWKPDPKSQPRSAESAIACRLGCGRDRFACRDRTAGIAVAQRTRGLQRDAATKAVVHATREARSTVVRLASRHITQWQKSRFRGRRVTGPMGP